MTLEKEIGIKSEQHRIQCKGVVRTFLSIWGRKFELMFVAKECAVIKF